MSVNGFGWLTQRPPLDLADDRQADVAHHGGAQAFVTKREDIATRLFAPRVPELDGMKGDSKCVIAASDLTAGKALPLADERFADGQFAARLMQAPAQRIDAPSGGRAEADIEALIEVLTHLCVAGAPIDAEDRSRSIAGRTERLQQDEADAARRLVCATDRCALTAALAWWGGGLHAAAALAGTVVAETERSAIAAAAWIDAALLFYGPTAGAAQEHMAGTNQGGGVRDAVSHRKSGPAAVL